MADDAVVKAVAAQLADITEEQVKMVVEAWNAVRDGEPVGTVLTDPETGDVGCRVCVDGVPMWEIVSLNGGRSRDLQPTLAGWSVLKEGETK